MLCSSCGHDNPRENRYCGMCGTPFAHNFLPVPDEQSALSFASAPLDVAPSPLPVLTPEPNQPETLGITTPVEASQLAVATPLPAEVPVAEPEPIVGIEQPQTPSPAEALLHEHVPVAEAAALATAPEIIPVEFSEPEHLPSAAEHKPAPVESLQDLAAGTKLPVEPSREAPTPPPGAAESTPHLPEIRRYATPHREAPPAHVDTGSLKPSSIQRPPAPQSLEPPPDSAGMPTFQSVSEASGAPPISPFEPPVAKDADEERELQEFVASFRYHPPEEAVDELTMRSEVPVLDAEAPVTPSHPSFDDDVPPPPEAGPHPTGKEYYPPIGASADRSRYLEIADTHHAAPSHGASTSATTSFLGLGDSPPDSSTQLDEANPPKPTRKFLWSSLTALLAIFGTLGFFEGRAQMNHAYQGPVEIVRERFVTLSHRLLALTASSPTTSTDKPASEEPASAEPQAKSPAATQSAYPDSKAQPESSADENLPASRATQSQATPDQQQPNSPARAPQISPATDNKDTVTASAPPVTVTQPKSPTAAAAAKTEPASEPPPAVAKPKLKSKPDPGQQELANAMQASDPAAAAAWLWKATSRGNSVAPVRLADMYIKGKGVPRSCEQALVLLRSEAAKENAPARNRLAALYANGTCVPRDRVKAYQLMSSALAVDPSSDWAEQNRKELWQQMTPEERAQAEKPR